MSYAMQQVIKEEKSFDRNHQKSSDEHQPSLKKRKSDNSEYGMMEEKFGFNRKRSAEDQDDEKLIRETQAALKSLSGSWFEPHKSNPKDKIELENSSFQNLFELKNSKEKSPGEAYKNSKSLFYMNSAFKPLEQRKIGQYGAYSDFHFNMHASDLHNISYKQQNDHTTDAANEFKQYTTLQPAKEGSHADCAIKNIAGSKMSASDSEQVSSSTLDIVSFPKPHSSILNKGKFPDKQRVN